MGLSLSENTIKNIKAMGKFNNNCYDSTPKYAPIFYLYFLCPLPHTEQYLNLSMKGNI